MIPLHNSRWSHLTQPVDGLVALFRHPGIDDRLRVIPPGTTTMIESTTAVNRRELLHIRLRKGKPQQPRLLRFRGRVDRARSAGATGEKLFRGHWAFWNKTLMRRLRSAGWLYSISIRMQSAVADAMPRFPNLTADARALLQESGAANGKPVGRAPAP